MTKVIPFATPDIDDKEIAEVIDSMRSGWLTSGPKTEKFEKEFAAFIGNDLEAIAVNSATAGLHLALEAVGIGPEDEVITTVYTFTATAEVIRYLGAHPVFVDIDPNTFNINPNKIEAAITKKTKAIIIVHFAGLPCDMEKIIELAKKHNLKIIEDAAHALPSYYKNKIIGSLDTDATVYSFYATKTITTGEGGMIITKDKKLTERCKIMRLHGIKQDVFNRYASNKSSWFYQVIAPGFKYNMTDIAASIGIAQLRKAHSFHKKRIEIAAIYNEKFKDLPILLPPTESFQNIHAWHLYVIRLTKNSPINRDNFIKLMAKEGIGCSVHFIPLHLHPYWRDRYKLKPNDYPNAFNNYQNAISLPLYTKMIQSDINKVAHTAKKLLTTESVLC